MVVHGLDGLDEISNIGKTLIAWLRGEEVKTFEVTPKDLGLRKASREEIVGSNPVESGEITFKLLYGRFERHDPKRDMVVLNAAAGIMISGKADDFRYGMELAQESIESGAAYKKLKDLMRSYEGSSLSKLEELEAKYG